MKLHLTPFSLGFLAGDFTGIAIYGGFTYAIFTVGALALLFTAIDTFTRKDDQ